MLECSCRFSPLGALSSNQVNSSVGEQLRQAREQRSLSLEQVAQVTHMRVHYLQALELNDLEFDPIPGSGARFPEGLRRLSRA